MEEIKKLTPIFNHKMAEIDNQDLEVIEKLNSKIEFANDFSKELFQQMFTVNFGTPDEQIFYFKHVKPHIGGISKFLNCKLNYLQDGLWFTDECREIFLKNKLAKIKDFKKEHKDLYNYLKFEKTSLDELYFLLANNKDLAHIPKEELYESVQYGMNTYYSSLVSKMKYYKLKEAYFKEELTRITNIKNGVENKNEENNSPKLIWTGSKRDIIELLKALDATNSINNGDDTFQTLVDSFGNLLNIDLKNHYKIFSEMRNRGGEQLPYLEKLKVCLQENIHKYNA